jgi:hypothetical protein
VVGYIKHTTEKKRSPVQISLMCFYTRGNSVLALRKTTVSTEISMVKTARRENLTKRDVPKELASQRQPYRRKAKKAGKPSEAAGLPDEAPSHTATPAAGTATSAAQAASPDGPPATTEPASTPEPEPEPCEAKPAQTTPSLDMFWTGPSLPTETEVCRQTTW